MNYSSLNLNSEEDIKLKVIVPYLLQAGLTMDDLEFEANLILRLGTNNHQINGTDIKRGRIDILCKKDGRNLFIMEVKKDNKEIDLGDAEQAISYARLVHPIAPYVFVTNGKKTEIFNTYTKVKVNEIKVDGNFNISIDDELRMRYEALSNFIGYSIENVKEFTKSQITQNMRTLLGDESDLGKKFIPQLFVVRNNLDIEFQYFINSKDKCFALIGESGVGKTNSMCDIALKSSSDNIVLFYNGTFLIDNIVNSIKSDFNWVFSQKLETVDILRKLEGLTDKNNLKIILFIDAVDEVQYLNFDSDLNNFLKELEKFTSVKVCISCKSYEWHRYKKKNGQPTYVYENLYKRNPYNLMRFTSNELELVDKKYRASFNYKNKLTNKMKQEANLGIMFRVLAEVYEGKDLPKEYNELDLLNAFFEKKTEKIDSEITKNVLKKLGSLLIENDRKFEWNEFVGMVDEDFLREKLNIAITDKLIPELFSHNILARFENKEGKKSIGFYFNRFKDYVIAIISYNLNNLSDEEFYVVLKKLIEGQNGQEAILWYINVASNQHLKVIKRLIKERAEEFIKAYNNFLDRTFSVLKDKFEPFTKNSVGLIVQDDLDFSMIKYALREIDPQKKELVEFIPLSKIVEFDYLQEEYKVHSSHASRYNFITITPKKHALNLITDQLKKLVERQKIDESNNKGLTLETIQAIVYQFSDELGFKSNKNKLKISNIQKILPLNLEKLRKNIEIIFARDYVKQQLIDAYMNTNRENSYTSKYNEEVESILSNENINEKIYDLINNKRGFPIYNKQNGVPYKDLYDSIISLGDLQEIKELYLPLPGISDDFIINKSTRINELFVQLPKVFTLLNDEELVIYIRNFFKLYFEEYKTIIETNFFEIRHLFSLYKKLPVHYYIELCTNRALRRWEITHGIKKENTNENIVKVVINKEETEFDNNVEIQSWTSQMLERFFKQSSSSLSGVDLKEFCPLRGYLYENLRVEIINVIKLLNEIIN